MLTIPYSAILSSLLSTAGRAVIKHLQDVIALTSLLCWDDTFVIVASPRLSFRWCKDTLMNLKIGVVGLGYVGLPVALAFSRKFPGTVGFDINRPKVDKLREFVDETGEISPDELKSATLQMTADLDDLSACNFFVVAVPTPIDSFNKPDLSPVIAASKTVGKALTKGSIVVFESTVYPGVTEEICGPILAEVSGLKPGKDFKLGYSPERINPGDKEHTIENIVKVVAGEDEESTELIASTYGKIIDAGIHRAESIKVAEAAKVIENTQRDLNIALMNELALIFDRMNIKTSDVLRAAGTKWNFLPFRPGLVGGHCIGVDPYYLTTKAEELGYIPEVILAGRRINDNVGKFIAQKTVKLMLGSKINLAECKVAILGLTFKENVPDIRNSRVPDILAELRSYNIEPVIVDPVASKDEAKTEYDIKLAKGPDGLGSEFDACILAVSHKQFLEHLPRYLKLLSSRGKSVFIDVKSAVSPKDLGLNTTYWSL